MTRIIWTLTSLVFTLLFLVSGVLTLTGVKMINFSKIYDLVYTLSLLIGIAFLYLKYDKNEMQRRPLFKIGFGIAIVGFLMNILHLPLNLVVMTIGLAVIIIDFVRNLIQKEERELFDYSRVMFLTLFISGHLVAGFNKTILGEYFTFSAILFLWIGIVFEIKENGIPGYGLVEAEQTGDNKLE